MFVLWRPLLFDTVTETNRAVINICQYVRCKFGGHVLALKFSSILFDNSTLDGSNNTKTLIEIKEWSARCKTDCGDTGDSYSVNS